MMTSVITDSHPWEWRDSDNHVSNEDGDYSVISSGGTARIDDLLSVEGMTPCGSSSASKDHSLLPHDDVVARAELLLLEAGKVIDASNRKKQDKLIGCLVARINDPQACPRDDNMTMEVAMERNIERACQHTHKRQHRLGPSDVQQPTKKQVRWTHVLLLWKEANGSYGCKVPTARNPAVLQLADIIPFACALWASGARGESWLPDDVLGAKLEVVLFNDSIQCDFLPHDGVVVPGRNYFACTVLTQRQTRGNRMPLTKQEQKPYLCLIMALLRRLRIKLLSPDRPHSYQH
jgi:hypothetical protein